MAKTAKVIFESDSLTFKNLMVTVSSTKNRTKIIDALKQANDVFTNSLAIVSSERKYSEIKKPLTAINNTISGLIHGIQEEAIKYSDTKRSLLVAQDKFFNVFCSKVEEIDQAEQYKNQQALIDQEKETNISTAAESDAHTKLEVNSNSFKDQVGMWKKFEAEKRLDLENNKDKSPVIRAQDEKLIKILDNWQKKKAELPTGMKGKLYGLMRMPLFARFASPSVTNSKNLASLGIRHVVYGEGDETVNQYPILEDQTLMYFDQKEIKKQMNMEPLDFAREMLDVQNSRQHTKYTLVTEQYRTCPKKTNLLMFWIMPLSIFNSLVSKQHSGSSKKTPSAEVLEWDLPFNRTE